MIILVVVDIHESLIQLVVPDLHKPREPRFRE
jgi:hypothetical protein